MMKFPNNFIKYFNKSILKGIQGTKRSKYLFIYFTWIEV